jgi:hypothetical protein
MEREGERAAATRDVFRRANDALAASAAKIGHTGSRPYLCECSNPRCTRAVVVDAAVYDAIRATPGRYVVARGHEEGLGVVEDAEGYVVVAFAP